MTARRYTPGGLIEFFPARLLAALTRFLNQTEGYTVTTVHDQMGAYLALVAIYLDLWGLTLPTTYLTTINRGLGISCTPNTIARQREVLRPLIPGINDRRSSHH